MTASGGSRWIFAAKPVETCVANLAVIDGSILPTSFGVNPSLTIDALAARAAAALAERMRGRA